MLLIVPDMPTSCRVVAPLRPLREQDVGSSNLPASTNNYLILNFLPQKIKVLSRFSVFILCLLISSWIPAQASSSAIYTVSRGDNLSVISQRFGISLGDLRRANDLNSDIIQVGQKLKIQDPFKRTRSRDLRWQRPLGRKGTILRPFGPYKVKGILMPRTGTDVACATGSAIYCPGNGVVRHIGHMDGFGTLLIIEHGAGFSSVLAPFVPGAVEVQIGQAVLRGDLLGRTGPPVEGDEPYLHVELRHNDKAIKPNRLLK